MLDIGVFLQEQVKPDANAVRTREQYSVLPAIEGKSHEVLAFCQL